MTTAPQSESKCKAWLSLLRVPNLFTVPGDPMAGFFLAAGLSACRLWPLAVVVCAAVLFYAAGLLLNDVADKKYDARYNPHRPIPAQQVSCFSVSIVAAVLLLLALVLCAGVGWLCLCVGLLLTVAVLLYDFVLKSIPVVGALCMGLCRGLSLLLGASAYGLKLSPVILSATCLLVLYVAMVTHLARGEKENAPVGVKRWLPSAAFITGSSLLIMHMPDLLPAWHYVVLFIGMLIVVLITRVAIQIGAESRNRLPHSIGRLIAALIPIQIMLLIASGHPGAGMMTLILCACAAAHYQLARYFYAS